MVLVKRRLMVVVWWWGCQDAGNREGHASLYYDPVSDSKTRPPLSGACLKPDSSWLACLPAGLSAVYGWCQAPVWSAFRNGTQFGHAVVRKEEHHIHPLSTPGFMARQAGGLELT